MMLIGSLVFAYLVGSFCGLAANLSPDVVSFRQDLTDLNRFLKLNAIPTSLRYRLREYMHQTVFLRRAATGNRLLSELAPKLRNEAALCFNGKWLQKIPLLTGSTCEEEAILELAFSLSLQVFPPGEVCPNGYIYIVNRGAALFMGRAFVAGKSWGEADALLTSEWLRSPSPATAIAYLFTFSIDGDTLRSTLSQKRYPAARSHMRYHQLRWIVRRGVVRLAEEEIANRIRHIRGERGLERGRSSLKVPTSGSGLTPWKKVLCAAMSDAQSASGGDAVQETSFLLAPLSSSGSSSRWHSSDHSKPPTHKHHLSYTPRSSHPSHPSSNRAVSNAAILTTSCRGGSAMFSGAVGVGMGVGMG
eukprot:CAMPEP_0174726532 /NCGR_PEP_ID=MMETSP1094-20130205/47993_1 /TAXON_ID=156173 /ORGANISM="Chrysochromulina brevifilum, Strain UTEX LB 985" /LENGTH=359 /DNA_ID=CAMNT_0015928129 /DNA_START=131 /DNA_END=1206 /DNA_ORIENTATION=-